MGPYRIRLLGPLAIEPATSTEAPIESRKGLALLAYLARHEQPVTRSQLADLLWGETSASRGRRNLTRELALLNERLPGCLHTTYHAVAWQPVPDVWLDAMTFMALVMRGNGNVFAPLPVHVDVPTAPPADPWFPPVQLPAMVAADLAAAVALYRGEFLAGFDLPGCPEFETWLIQEREFWRQQVTTALALLISDHARRHEDPEASRYAQRWLALEPWQEEAHRYLMVLLARNGRRGAALIQYDVCRRILATELAVEPTDETMELHAQIRAGAFQVARS